MAEQASPRPPDSHQLMEDLSRFFQHAFAWLQEKIKHIYTLLRERGMRPKSGRKVSEILSHWHKLFEDFQESPQRIYGLLEEAIDKRKIPDVKVSRIVYPEGAVLSDRREYLRVQRKQHTFDICAAPFGTGFFISWWLGRGKRLSWLLIVLLAILLSPLLLVLIPVLLFAPYLLIPILIPVAIVVWLFRRVTYYRIDTILMFQDSVHSAVMEVIDQVTEGKGIKALSELEKKPIQRNFLKRKLA